MHIPATVVGNGFVCFAPFEQLSNTTVISVRLCLGVCAVEQHGFVPLSNTKVMAHEQADMFMRG